MEAGEGAPGAGFLPRIYYTVNNGERGDDRDDPKRGSHAIEEAAHDEEDDALGALHEANFAERDERFGAGARVADHHRACGGDRREDDVGRTAVDGVIHQQSHVERHIGVAIESGIVEGSERGDFIGAAGDLSIEHVEEAGEKNYERGGLEAAGGEHYGGCEIDDEPDESKCVGINSSGGECTDNAVEQPAASFSDRACDGHREPVNHTL